jgi:hypothetical protein
MRTLYTITAAIGAALLTIGLAGCFGRAGGPPPEANRIQIVQVVCQTAAADATRLALRNDPDTRPQFEAGLAGFRALASTNYSAADFASALEKLPIVMSGGDGALYMTDGGVLLFSIVAGFVDLQDPPLLAAALRGTCAGLESALRQPPK